MRKINNQIKSAFIKSTTAYGTAFETYDKNYTNKPIIEGSLKINGSSTLTNQISNFAKLNNVLKFPKTIQ